MKNSREGDNLKITTFAILQKSVKKSKLVFRSFYTWTPYAHSTTDRMWQNDIIIWGTDVFEVKNFLKEVLKKVWSSS